jgi:hypothetical protein
MDFNCGYYLEVQKRCLIIKVFWALCQFERAKAGEGHWIANHSAKDVIFLLCRRLSEFQGEEAGAISDQGCAWAENLGLSKSNLILR